MSKHTAKHAFTLVELLVVMAIIAILISITLGVAGRVSSDGAETKAKGEIAFLQQEIELYRADRGSLPPSRSVNGTSTLTQDFYDWYEEKYGDGDGTFDEDDRIYDGTETRTNSNQLYPVDPWGQPYVYIVNANNPFIYFIGSKGPNKQFGTGEGGSVFGDGDDISTRKGSNL